MPLKGRFTRATPVLPLCDFKRDAFAANQKIRMSQTFGNIFATARCPGHLIIDLMDGAQTIA